MILVFGSVCLDRVRRIAALPPAGGYAEVQSEETLLGGEAANTANALAFWGADVRLAGNALGTGASGERLRALLRARGLLERWVYRDVAQGVAPVCDVYLTPDGERTMFGRGFADSAPVDPPEALPFAPGEWFTAEPNMSGPARAAANAAARAGMRVYRMDFFRPDEILEPGSFWQSSTDWVGRRGDIQRNVAWVRDHVAAHGTTTILSDGPNGFVAGGPERPARHYPPFPAPVVVDTTGAGDTFRAGVLLGLDSGWALGRALAFGAAAGALKCRSFGATVAVPTREEIEGWIAANPEVSAAYGD